MELTQKINDTKLKLYFKSLLGNGMSSVLMLDNVQYLTEQERVDLIELARVIYDTRHKLVLCMNDAMANSLTI